MSKFVEEIKKDKKLGKKLYKSEVSKFVEEIKNDTNLGKKTLQGDNCTKAR